MLEAHEILPSPLDQKAPSQQAQVAKTRALRRVHAQYHSSIAMDSRRIAFSLDIPSDASPAFRVTLDDAAASEISGPVPGGLEWRVRMCFLVSMGSEQWGDGSATRHLVRDGSGGEWGTSWKATPGLAPITRSGDSGDNPYSKQHGGSGWSLFSTRLIDQPAEDDVDGWRECSGETVECEVGIDVWPGNTLYRPAQLDFNV